MTALNRWPVTGFDRTRRLVVTVAFASIGLATGCSSASIDDGSPVAAAGDALIVGESTVPATAPATSPSLPTLQELLAEDRFVALRVALERSGLDTVIDGLDDFVLLAPIGAAFESIGADVGIDYPTLMNNPQLLEAVMRYHIVADPTTNQSWRTLNGSSLDVDGSNAAAIERVDGIEVLDRVPVRNGTVLVMPRLLLPALRQGITSPSQRED